MKQQELDDLLELVKAAISDSAPDAGVHEAVRYSELKKDFEEKHIACVSEISSTSTTQTLAAMLHELSEHDYLRDLSDRIMVVPVMYGVGQEDSERLNEIAQKFFLHQTGRVTA